jgi:transcriptional regulator with XRE-family HTH domain
MVNTEDFIKRLEIIFDYYSVSASGFADKIGVQRSSLSHLLSGRNKPSLDFILKILDVFPEVDLYWILNGKGNFPKIIDDNILPQIQSPAPTPTIEKVSESIFKEIEKAPAKIPVEVKNESPQENKSTFSAEDKIEKIVIFYSSGRFIEYNPK